MSYLHGTFKELQLANRVNELREALEELMAAWPTDSLPPHELCMKCAEAINKSKQ